MHRRPSRLLPQRATAALVAAATLLALSGCSGGSQAADDDVTTSTTTPPETPAETTSATDPSASSEPTTAEPTSSGAPTTTPPAESPPGRARQALISRADLPGFNDEWRWTTSRTRVGPGQDVASVCMQGSLTAIGGVTEYRRDFSSRADSSAYATQMSTVFPDAQTAQRAVAVLQAWQKGCERYAARRLKLNDVSVSEDRPVATPVGTGHQWLVTHAGPEPDTSWFTAEGYLLDGDTLSYLVIAVVSQDYNYEAGDEPMDHAIEVAGDYLAKTR